MLINWTYKVCSRLWARSKRSVVGDPGCGCGEIMGLFHKEPPEAWGNFVLSITRQCRLHSQAQTVSWLQWDGSLLLQSIIQYMWHSHIDKLIKSSSSSWRTSCIGVCLHTTNHHHAHWDTFLQCPLSQLPIVFLWNLTVRWVFCPYAWSSPSIVWALLLILSD